MNETSRVKPHLSAGAGFLMGSADAVPGVSGGTIALIVGIYDSFISSLSTMVKSPFLIRRSDGRQQILGALRLLIPLGIGLILGYLLVTRLLVGKSASPGLLLRPDTAHIGYAFLFGLVLLSIPEPWRRIQAPRMLHAVVFFAAAALAVWFIGLEYVSTTSRLALFFGGAGAVAVMLLPGISGSLLLVIIGQYTVVGQAVHDKNWGTLAVFVAGIGLGIALFIPVLKVLLSKHFSVTMAGLTGLMAGSLRAVWPYKDNYDPKIAQMENSWATYQWYFVVLAAIAGGLVVFALRKFEHAIMAAEARDTATGDAT